MGYRLRRKVGDIQGMGVGVSALGYRLRRKAGKLKKEDAIHSQNQYAR